MRDWACVRLPKSKERAERVYLIRSRLARHTSHPRLSQTIKRLPSLVGSCRIARREIRLVDVHLGKQSIQGLTALATAINTQGKHTVQTKTTREPNGRSTLRTDSQFLL